MARKLFKHKLDWHKILNTVLEPTKKVTVTHPFGPIILQNPSQLALAKIVF